MQVKAHVTDVHQFDTARGHRLYTVFRTLDGCEIAVWTSDPDLQRPQIGDPVMLTRDRQGSLHFNPNSWRR